MRNGVKMMTYSTTKININTQFPYIKGAIEVGMTYESLGSTYGVTRQRIGQICKKHGIVGPRAWKKRKAT